jgi:hypothetical protein
MSIKSEIKDLISLAKTNCFAQMIACINVMNSSLPYECHPKKVDEEFLKSLNEIESPILIACKLKSIEKGHAFALVSFEKNEWSLVQAYQDVHELKYIKNFDIENMILLLNLCDAKILEIEKISNHLEIELENCDYDFTFSIYTKSLIRLPFNSERDFF